MFRFQRKRRSSHGDNRRGRITSEMRNWLSRFLPWGGVVVSVCFAPRESLGQAPNSGLRVERSRVTGLASFVTAADGGPILDNGNVANAVSSADAFLRAYGTLFGVTDSGTQLILAHVRRDNRNELHSTFRQVHKGVPVFSGALKVHQDAARHVFAANGDFHPIDAGLGIIPSFSAEAASRIAARELEPTHPTVEKNELVLVDPGWYGDPPTGTRLAYYLILTDWTAGVREAFFVDAQTGKVLDRWSLIETARNRQIYNGASSTELPGELARAEGDPPDESLEDVNRAYDYYGDTYDYFLRAFDRDSIDDFGLPMVATVNSRAAGCPNAFWSDSLLQMAFCKGTVSDDVTAHELTHGITNFSADLIYQNQSGQLNESFSDVFGELVDLFNGDAAVSGAVGESVWPMHETGPGTDTPNRQRTICETNAQMVVNTPDSIGGEYPASSARYGPELTAEGVTGDLVVAVPQDACPTDTDASPFDNADEFFGKVVLVAAGGCVPSSKVASAERTGAIAVIMVANTPFDIPNMGSSPEPIGIPSIGIRQTDGATILAASALGTVNLTLRKNADPGVRWLVAEDATAFGGAIRDMWDPTCMSDPDRANSPLQTCGPGDNGGVHSGSGIPNHAFAMVVDGKAFNGYTVRGIGPVKAGAVWYRALTTYLTPASDFQDAYVALNQSARDLMGEFLADPRTGAPIAEPFTADDAEQIDLALRAAEMDTQGRCGRTIAVLDSRTPPSCGNLTQLFFDDFENGAPGWIVSNSRPPTPYDWALTREPLPYGRAGIAVFCSDPDIGDCDQVDESSLHSLKSPPVFLPQNARFPLVRFAHYIDSEQGYDGGTVSIRVNGVAWRAISGEFFEFNPYNSVLRGTTLNNTNPLAGRQAWTGIGGEWGESQIDLRPFAGGGDTIELRFDFGKDGCTGRTGWFIDDFAVFACDDCNRNNRGDQKDILFTTGSPPLGTIGAGSPQRYTFRGLPRAASDVQVRFSAIADLFGEQNDESLYVSANGTFLAEIFANGASDCPRTPDVSELTIPASQFNQIVAGGELVLDIVAAPMVDATRCGGANWVKAFLEYTTETVDQNGDGVPDECQQCSMPLAPMGAPDSVPMNRYVAFSPRANGRSVAYRVRRSVSANDRTLTQSSIMWVGPPRVDPGPAGTKEPLSIARLQCDPHYASDWTDRGVIYLYGPEIVPGASYVVDAIDLACAQHDSAVRKGTKSGSSLIQFSSALTLNTVENWGDVVGATGTDPPDGRVDEVDVAAAVDLFIQEPEPISILRADLYPAIPDRAVDFHDVSLIVDALRGMPYPFMEFRRRCP